MYWENVPVDKARNLTKTVKFFGVWDPATTEHMYRRSLETLQRYYSIQKLNNGWKCIGGVPGPSDEDVTSLWNAQVKELALALKGNAVTIRMVLRDKKKLFLFFLLSSSRTHSMRTRSGVNKQSPGSGKKISVQVKTVNPTRGRPKKVNIIQIYFHSCRRVLLFS